MHLGGAAGSVLLILALAAASRVASAATDAGTAANASPMLTQPPDFSVFAGRTLELPIGASDADGQPLQFYVASGPAYLTVRTSIPELGWGYAAIAPSTSDAGDTAGVIGVTDGALSDEKSFGIHIYDASPAATRFQVESSACIQVPPPPTNFQVTMPEGTLFARGEPLLVEVDINWPGHSWRVDLAPALGKSLETGYVFYSDPALIPGNLAGGPNLMVVRDGSGWYGTTASFEIKRIVFGPSNSVVSLWATFEQECAGGLNLRGEIRYNAPVDVSVSAPAFRVVERDHLLEFGVSATDADGGSVTLSAPTLPTGATFTDHLDGTGSFAWAPAYAQRGIHVARFEVTDETDHRGSAVTTIRVRGETMARFVIPYGFGGDGDPVVLTPATEQFDIEIGTGTNAGADVSINRGDDRLWQIDMVPPSGSELTVGVYEQAQDFPVSDPTRPALGIVWNHSVYLGLDHKRFEIKQIERDPLQGILRLWATFEVGDGYNEPLKGEIRYDANAASARAFTIGANRSINLIGAMPMWYLQVEPPGYFIEVNEPNYASLKLRRVDANGVTRELIPDPAATRIVPDQDGNGIPERALAFRMVDVQSFFDDIRGRKTVSLELAGVMVTGEAVSEAVTVNVTGLEGALAVTSAPNPLNPGTVISFHTPAAGKVTIRIFDVLGRLIRTLDQSVRPAGYHALSWDGTTDRGGRVASGVYQLLLDTPSGSQSRRLTVIR